MPRCRFSDDFLCALVADIGPRKRGTDHILSLWLSHWLHTAGVTTVDRIVAFHRLKMALYRYRSRCRWRTVARPSTRVADLSAVKRSMNMRNGLNHRSSNPHCIQSVSNASFSARDERYDR